MGDTGGAGSGPGGDSGTGPGRLAFVRDALALLAWAAALAVALGWTFVTGGFRP